MIGDCDWGLGFGVWNGRISFQSVYLMVHRLQLLHLQRSGLVPSVITPARLVAKIQDSPSFLEFNPEKLFDLTTQIKPYPLPNLKLVPGTEIPKNIISECPQDFGPGVVVRSPSFDEIHGFRLVSLRVHVLVRYCSC